MPPNLPNLREITRQFGRGEATLESLRGAALGEHRDRQLAGEILTLINAWERDPYKDSVRCRNDLRAHIKQLVPPAPAAAEASKSRREPGESLYAAGLRGQQRRRD